MNLLIDNRTEEMLTAELEEAILKAAAESLKYEEFDENCEISVSIVDNEEIRQINKQFRNIDRATDVLSFPMLTFEEGEEAEVNENDEIILGDIIISLERAREQAEVRAPKYGIGTVVSVNPGGADFEVEVSFGAKGTKKFMARLSKLIKVSE